MSVSFKLLERFTLNRITPIIDHQLPKEQAGSRRGYCTTGQVVKLAQDIDDGYEH